MGDNVIALPHRLAECQMLNMLKINVPSPIKYYYNWPGRFAPMQHQRETAALFTLERKFICLNQIGTGKTMAALWAADYLLSIGEIQRAVIVAPLSTLERVWGDAIFMNLPHRKFTVLHGTAKKRKQLVNKDCDFYIVNHDGFAIVANELQQRGDIDLLLVDESAVYRNANTDRFKVLRNWLNTAEPLYRWYMTATPIPNEPTDAWAQAILLGSKTVPRSFGRFKEMTMQKVSMFKWKARPDALDTVYEVLQPSVRYKRDECTDLPGTITQTRTAVMSKMQKQAYRYMADHFEIEYEEGKITAANEGVRLNKLLQIACGGIYNHDREWVSLDPSHKLRALKQIIEEAGEKVIIFIPFTGAIHAVNQYLANYYSTAVVNKDVTARVRSEIFRDFQHGDNPKILIAHPRTMAHGLTLTRATTIVWYGPIQSNDIHEQACGRITRIGQTDVANIVYLESTQVEHECYHRLAERQNLQGTLLSMFANGVKL